MQYQSIEIGFFAPFLPKTCGRGGGYILAGSASMDKGNAENLRAMMDAAKKYGIY